MEKKKAGKLPKKYKEKSWTTVGKTVTDGDRLLSKIRNGLSESTMALLDKGLKPFDPTTATTFEECIENRLSATRLLLLVKGKEYVRNDDRFHNFHRAAETNRTTPTRALHGMMSKHYVSLMDILDDIDKGKTPSVVQVEEKIGDLVVYLLLQEALIKHKINTKEI